MSNNNRIGGYRMGKVPDNATKKRMGKINALPQKVDLRSYMTDVEEQVGNSCVANAFAGAYEYLAKRELGESFDVSRLFIYYNARAYEGAEGKDEGSMASYTIETLKEHGVCSEEYWTNDEEAITEEPHEDAYNHAADFRIVEAQYVETDLDLWKNTLAEGYPIIFGLNTFESFDEANEKKGRVPLPKKSDNVRETHGWHCMLCVGYSDPDKMFIVRNSWSDQWGDKGYCYIPYDYVINEEFNAHDSWIIQSVENLDFGSETWDESEESNFAVDGMLYLDYLSIQVEDVEEFAEALEELCLEYAETDEDYYFDYESYKEKKELYTEITNFEILTEDPDAFLEALEEFCEEWAIDGNYEFTVAGEEEEE